jgi:hypothetical protein
VELLYRGGANTVGEQQFTLLYSRACEVAFTFRNIKVRLESNWLVFFNPDVITQGSEASSGLDADRIITTQTDLQPPNDLSLTPVNADNLTALAKPSSWRTVRLTVKANIGSRNWPMRLKRSSLTAPFSWV